MIRLLPFDYAVRNLGRSRTRLMLFVLGSALVVMLMIAAGAFVRGMSTSLGVSGSAENVILLGAGSEESIERSEVPGATPGILEASVSGIRSRAGVSYVSPQVHVMLPVHVGADHSPTARQVLVRGITPAALLVHEHVRVIEGRLPHASADEVLIGRMAGTMLNAQEKDLAIGNTVMIDGKPWQIVGRFAAPGTVMEGELWVPLASIMAATKRETISCVVMTLNPDEADFSDIAIFTKMRPDLELSAMPEREYYAHLGEFFTPIKFVAWVTAGLIAVGGLFGGLNTMYAAFSSRVREVGTLQSLGFRRLSIVISLVQESVLATAAGALIACAIGLFALDGLAVRFSMGAFGLIVDPVVLAVGLAAGLFLGLIGALPPALRCLRMEIPAALKAF